MIPSDADVAERIRSHLSGASVPEYDERAIYRKAAARAGKPEINRRLLFPLILLALVIPALGLGFTQREEISSAVLMFIGHPDPLKAVTIQTHRLTFAQGCPFWSSGRREQVCLRRVRAWISRLPSEAPFRFVSPRGLPSGSSACGYMFAEGLYGITYCRPSGRPTRREFTISFLRYQRGVYEPGDISTLRSPGLSMSWRPKYHPQIRLWVVGNELVMVDVFDTTLSETEALRIQTAMHGSPLTAK